MRCKAMKGLKCHKICLLALWCVALRVILLWCYGVISSKNTIEELNLSQNENTPKTTLTNSSLSMTRVSVKHLRSKSSHLVLYSAVATNSTRNSTWDIVAVQGWMHMMTETKFACCVLYSSGEILLHFEMVIEHWVSFWMVKYGALQFQCRIQNKRWNGIPVKVTIITVAGNSKGTCSKDLSRYLKIDYAYNLVGIAVFLKVLYAQLSYLDLLAWFEIHRILGVNRVLGYVTDDLNEQAKVVLGHYQQTGLFQALHFPIPFEDQERVMKVGVPKSWNYRGVSMFDGQVRLSGYEYIVSIDPDEYLLPTNSTESLRTVFERLFQKKQNTAGFIFSTYLFIKNWGGDQNSSFSVEKYLLRSKATRDRVKHVTIPQRVKLGGLRTHKFIPLPNFKRWNADTNDIAVYHFRACRIPVTGKKTLPCDLWTRVRDDIVHLMFKSVKENIEKIRQLYGM